jgi:anti-sigma regulatory factor (Ser/Thr protein kinase)
VVIRVVTAGTELVASVIDDARPFNPLEAPKPNLDAPLEDRELGGLGIHLVRSLMDHVSYSRDEDKNVLTVRKRIR